MRYLIPTILLTSCLLNFSSRAADPRRGEIRHLNNYFPMQPVASAEAWTARADTLRRQVQLAAGLLPMPRRTPLNAVIHGKVDRDTYTVERVYFESSPGHYVSGSLYRPKIITGKIPAVLCPHGHWNQGRFHDHGDGTIKNEMASGAESFDSGRHPLQARCVHLARMGCIVFHYDMIGYADSIQLDHRPGVRAHMNTMKDWGYFSPQAELRLQSMMQLQTWNSVRALDFVAGLPGVDTDRLAVTGASGGGTQTFMLTAIDPRIAAAFPAVMVSTGMQGGCTCENSNYLRINAGNIDIAALAAPRPLALSAADDWTKELMTKGFPDLQALYQMLGVPDRVHAVAHVQYKHNFNQVNRHAMYHWFNQHLKLGIDDPKESDFKPLTREELTVWAAKGQPEDGHLARPDIKSGDAHEKELLNWWTAEEQHTLTSLKDWKTFRSTIGGAWEAIIGRRMDKIGEVTAKDGKLVNRWGEEVSFSSDPLKGKVAILIDAGDDRVGEQQMMLGKLGYTCLTIRPIHLGKDAELLGKNDKNPFKRYVGYTYGYNHPGFVQRVHDILTATAYAKGLGHEVHLHGQGKTSHLAIAARFIAGDALDGAFISTGRFRFSEIDRLDHPDFVPGAVKYGDVDALIALCQEYPTVFSGWEPKKKIRFPRPGQ